MGAILFELVAEYKAHAIEEYDEEFEAERAGWKTAVVVILGRLVKSFLAILIVALSYSRYFLLYKKLDQEV